MNKPKGFTLIELMIVVVIFAIIVVIVISALTDKNRKKGAVAVTVEEREAVPNALKYEGRVQYIDIYTFTTSDGARCVLARRYSDFHTMNCEWPHASQAPSP